MTDGRLAVGVTSQFGDKCLVMRLRFAVIRDFCFQEESFELKKVVVKKRFLGHHQKFQKVHKIPPPSAQIQQNSSELILIC